MGKVEMTVSNIYMCIPMARFAVVTVSLPAISIAYCFISAFIFRHDEVNDTDCNNTNTIPSISAVTGIKPQAYVWRICIGLHSAPRFFVGIMYFNYYKARIAHVHYKKLCTFLSNLCFWLYSIECFCLLAVSSISNKENYPLHEKIFICFMVCCIANMVFSTALFKMTRHSEMTDLEKKSYFWKRVMLLCISLSTVGLLKYFFQHRFHCIPEAFSKFSVFEYLIAYSNIGFHVTAWYEFCDHTILTAHLQDTNANGTAKSSNGVSLHVNGSTRVTRASVKNGNTKLD